MFTKSITLLLKGKKILSEYPANGKKLAKALTSNSPFDWKTKSKHREHPHQHFITNSTPFHSLQLWCDAHTFINNMLADNLRKKQNASLTIDFSLYMISTSPPHSAIFQLYTEPLIRNNFTRETLKHQDKSIPVQGVYKVKQNTCKHFLNIKLLKP